VTHGWVEARIGKHIRQFELRAQAEPGGKWHYYECIAASLKGQMNGVVEYLSGGGPVFRMVPVCCICERTVDRVAQDRANSVMYQGREDRIANSAAGFMGGSLCGRCRRKVVNLQDEHRYYALSRDEYIRVLELAPSETQEALSRLRFVGMGVHMYIPSQWWDALTWVLEQAKRVVHLQAGYLRRFEGFQLVRPGDIQPLLGFTIPLVDPSHATPRTPQTRCVRPRAASRRGAVAVWPR